MYKMTKNDSCKQGTHTCNAERITFIILEEKVNMWSNKAQQAVI